MHLYEFILYGDGGLYNEGGLFKVEHYVAESLIDALEKYCKKRYTTDHSIHELYLTMMTPDDIIKKINEWTPFDEILCVQCIGATLYDNLT